MKLGELQKYKDKRVHFIAIGGCSMSGLALILNSLGFHVTGSDKNESTFTENLRKAGVVFTIGHDSENIPGAGLVVYNSAIKPGNPEYDRAKQLGVPMMERAQLLGLISHEYERVVCVSGCHGKTTITSMLSLILMQAGVDPTVHVGGMVNFLNGGVAIGESNVLVTEACEYVESFLALTPTHIILNNIDDDHLDYYRDIEHIELAFTKFIDMLPENGMLFVCLDDERASRVAKMSGKRMVTYALDCPADFTAADVKYDVMGCPEFTLTVKGESAGRIHMNILGRHNVQNALAAIALAMTVFGVSPEQCAKSLGEYRLTGRRFEYMGEKNGCRIFHDYAHHPSEIAACLAAASKYPHKRLIAVFQCNSYTRAKTLKDKYATCFADADIVLVPEIYPGRDKDLGEIHATDLVAAIAPHKEALYLRTFEEINDWLEQNAQEGDLVLTIGSGSVYKETKKLL